MPAEPFLMSVIVPVYNDEVHILDCAASILNQVYTNIELILVDDGSTDYTATLCDEIATWDNRVKVIHRDNGGPSAARNAGIRACSGDFIHFVDSDDWVEEDLYARIVPQLQLRGADIVFFGWVFEDENGYSDHQCRNARDGIGNTFDLMHDMLLQVGPSEDYRSYSNYLWNKIFKRKLVFRGENPILFDESISVAEDFVWLLTVVPSAKRGVFDSTPYYHYRFNPSGLTKAEDHRISAWLSSQSVHMRALEWLKEEGQDELYEVHKRSCIRYFTSNFEATAARGNIEAATRMLHNIQSIDEAAIPEILASISAKSSGKDADYREMKKLLKRRSVKLAISASNEARSLKERAKGMTAEKAFRKLKQTVGTMHHHS